MQRTEKEQVVAALIEQLRSTDSLIVADYRGLTNSQLAELRVEAADERGAAPGREEHAHAPRRRVRGRRVAAGAARGPDGDRVRRDRRRPGGGREGVRRHREGHEGPRPARRDALRTLDLGRRGRGAGQAAAARHGQEPARRRDRGSADSARRALTAPLRDLVGLIDARIAQLEEGGDASAPGAPPSSPRRRRNR